MKVQEKIEQLKHKVLDHGGKVSAKEALSLLAVNDDTLPYLMAAANEIRVRFKGKRTVLCSIVNARSGVCSEDCAFCAQSAHHKTTSPAYPLMGHAALVKAADKAAEAGCSHFGLVTSGKSANARNDFSRILEAVKSIAQKKKIRRCASIGSMTYEEACLLKKAGLQRVHHNLETSRSFFKKICTTHTYDERVQTVRNVKAAGLEICSGGIIGLGESPRQRVEFALALRELDVDSVPFNILNPIPGTPLGKIKKRISPREILKTLAMFRFVLPKQDIIICGGREVNLRDLQSVVFWAGANGVMTGNYLTTAGRRPEQDVQLLKDLNLSL